MAVASRRIVANSFVVVCVVLFAGIPFVDAKTFIGGCKGESRIKFCKITQTGNYKIQRNLTSLQVLKFGRWPANASLTLQREHVLSLKEVWFKQQADCAKISVPTDVRIYAWDRTCMCGLESNQGSYHSTVRVDTLSTRPTLDLKKVALSAVTLFLKAAKNLPSVKTQQTTPIPPSVKTQQTTEISPSVETQQTTEMPPSVETQQTTEMSPSVETQQTTEMLPSVETQQTTEMLTSVETRQTTEMLPSVETEQSTSSVTRNSDKIWMGMAIAFSSAFSCCLILGVFAVLKIKLLIKKRRALMNTITEEIRDTTMETTIGSVEMSEIDMDEVEIHKANQPAVAAVAMAPAYNLRPRKDNINYKV